MSYPNRPDKVHGSPLLTGEDMVAYRRKTGRFPKQPAPRSVLLCLEASLPHRNRFRYPTRKVGRFVGDMLLLRKHPGQAGIMVNFGIGAPVIAGMMEELAAWGVKNFVLISWAGGLAPDLETGDVVLCDKALRDDGVSHHYLPDARFVSADQRLQNAFQHKLETHGFFTQVGASWSTAAPYRETREEVLAYRDEGILTVEMEAAALFAVGQALGVQTSAAFVVGDRLDPQTGWSPPANINRVNQSFDRLYAVILDLFTDLD
jgi:uridine phosphorylase